MHARLVCLLLLAAQAQPQRPVIRSGVTYVETTVVVRDDRGQFVQDLAKGDFEVYEDGVRQDVATPGRIETVAPEERKLGSTEPKRTLPSISPAVKQMMSTMAAQTAISPIVFESAKQTRYKSTRLYAFL